MENLQKDFITYNHALRLKALGFNEPCFGVFSFEIFKFGVFSSLSSTENTILAPTFSQAFRWFRENYKMSQMIQITTSDGTRENWFWEIFDLQGRKVEDGQKLSDPYNSSPEEAESACLDKLIEIIESKEK